MSEATDATAAPLGAASAGRLLREARERQGLHIAALAASIKVAPKKLEALEADRFEALPDMTFTRALAQTVCRALKIDSAAILQLLPPPGGHRLEHVGEGLNAPFRERPGALVQRDGATLTVGPVFWLTALLLIAAMVVYFLPAGTIGMSNWRGRGASAPAGTPALATLTASARPEAASASDGAVGEAASGPGSPLAAGMQGTSPATTVTVATAPTDAAAEPITGVIELRTSAASWVEITDAHGHVLVARVIPPGETLGFDGEAPFRVRIGNAAGTRMSFRGQPIELAAYTRENVARFDLK